MTKDAILHNPAAIGEFLVVGHAAEFNLEFHAYEALAQNIDSDLFLYRRKDWESSIDMTDDITQAQPFLSGNIKWDGCCNVRFEEQTDNCYLRFCGRNETTKIGKLFDLLYDLAAKLIPAYEGD